MDEKEKFLKEYNNSLHRIGRITGVAIVVLLLAVPFLFGIVNSVSPDWGGVLSGFLKVGMIYVPVSIVEFLVYAPMLGVGGSYLSFLTGNVTNMKIPCAMNARDISKTEVGTPENEIVSTISVATSAIVTTLVIVVGVILIVPLTPILESPVLEPAFEQMLPALFGGLGVAFVSKNWKLAVAPVLLMLVLFIFVPALNAGSVGIMVPVSVVFTMIIARILYKRGVL